MNEQQLEEEKKSSPYLSLRKLKETEVYKNCLEVFNPEYQFLVEHAASKMI